MSSPITVLIADGHPNLRATVHRLLESKPEIRIVGEVEDGDEAITETLDLLPNVLLLDLAIPRLPGLEAMRAILGRWPAVRVLVVTAVITTQRIVEALQIGAYGMVTHAAIANELLPAIHAVVDGKHWLGGEPVPSLVPSLHDLVRQASSPKRAFTLTRREIAVIRCVAEGYSNRDIADKFELSEETVKRHLSNIFEKLGVSKRVELALFAINHNLVDPPK